MLYYLPILLTLAACGARILEMKRKRPVIAGKVREIFTFWSFVIIGAIMAFGSIAEYVMRGGGFTWIALIAGVACSVASFKLRWAAIAALGKFWSLHVEIRENHELVETGPFRFMRHPTYLSMDFELAAFALFCSAWHMLLFIPIIYIPVLIMRLRYEEPAMVEKFGDAYRDYQRRVPMLFPYKWPSRR